MLDIKLIREKPKEVKKNTKLRSPDKVGLVDDILKHDEEYRKLLKKLEDLRHKRNVLSEEINQLKKQGKDIKAKIKEIKELLGKVKKAQDKVDELKVKIVSALLRIPNMMHKSVPIGKDENDNVQVRKWGKVTKPKFALKSHVDLLEGLDLADTERAAKVAGARFFYLKNDLVLMDLALQKFAFDFLIKKGYTPFQVPMMLNRQVMEGVIDLSDFEDVIYKVEDEDLYLVGTSEHALAGYHMNETIDKKKLPLRYAGLSSCFRKEAGSHGKDTKGIFRVHQFNKIEQFIFSAPEDSWKLFEELLANAEELMKKLELPYRVMNMCSGDIGGTAAKKYDIEVWMPVQQAYREVVSCSNCTDYQARKLNVKCSDGKTKEIVHTLNATAIATSRTMVAILENYQQKDGSVVVPKVLQSYMGKKLIKPSK